MEFVYVAIVAAACVYAIINWRASFLLCICLDAVRDPIRKLSDDQPVWITVLALLPWTVTMVVALSSQKNELRAIKSRYPTFARAVQCVLLAITPGALLAISLYSSGALLALIGALSYTVPLAGLAFGYLLARDTRDIRLVCITYVLINSLLLVGAPLEFWKSSIAGLGGIRMEWIRHQPGYIVQLISGFYRSPDVMGLHAAHVAVFAGILACGKRPFQKVIWSPFIAWGIYAVVLCGRRKMIAIPLIFLATYLVFKLSEDRRRRPMILFSTALLACAISGLLMLMSIDSSSSEYTAYAYTSLSDAPDRLLNNIGGSVVVTLNQAGLLGAGLGTATQGRYYVAGTTARGSTGWQEDGISRLFLELGTPGVVLICIAAWLFCKTFRTAFQYVPVGSEAHEMQIQLAAVVAGDLASFAIAHQHLSGDPISALFVTICAGAILGAPRGYAVARSSSGVGLAPQSIARRSLIHSQLTSHVNAPLPAESPQQHVS